MKYNKLYKHRVVLDILAFRVVTDFVIWRERAAMSVFRGHIYIYESDLSDRRFLFRSHQARIADSRSSFGCALPSRNKRHVTECGAERFTNAVITIRFDCNMTIPRPSEIQLLLLLLLLFFITLGSKDPEG